MYCRLADSTTPVRVVLGYHGFSTESSFREALVELLENNVQSEGYGPADLPSLIICDRYSLIKINGMPFALPVAVTRSELYQAFGITDLPPDAPSHDNLWPVYASYVGNAMHILLELIWTRLTYSERLSPALFGDDLESEIPRPLLLTKAIEQDGRIGWYYEHFVLPEAVLNRIPAPPSWQPVEVTPNQAAVLHHLAAREAAGNTEGMSLEAPQLVAEFQNSNQSLRDAITFLQRARLVSLVDGKFRLLTREIAIIALSDRRLVAGDNHSGRLMSWLERFMQEHDSQDIT
jgi:hypothetical protein